MWSGFASDRKGVALMTGMMMLVVLAIVAGSVIRMAVNEYSMAKRNMMSAEALYLAEAGGEQAAYSLASYIANNFQDPPDSPAVNSITGTLNLTPGYAVNYSCVAYGAERAVTGAAGTVTFKKNYHITSAASRSDGLNITVNRIISRNRTPTFQHAVFYQDDLEMLPGKAMQFAGKIHSNHDIYIASDGSTLTINSDYLCSAGSIYNKRKDRTGSDSGTVNIQVKGTAATQPMLIGSEQRLDSLRSDWTDASQARWGGTAKSSVHGVTSLAVPTVGSIQPGGYYYANAALRIIDGAAYDNNNNPVTLPVGTITTGSFVNVREGGKTITVTDIDISKLNGSGRFPANGLLYATRSDASTSRPNGIRLKGGSTLQGALTVASNDPVYIQGNYNNDAKKPAAVICDSVNILSGKWSDGTNPGSRVAEATEVDAAFIAGVDRTSSGDYNGGVENYPRLLENWSDVTFTLKGSFVEMWNPQIASGHWNNGGYSPPKLRNWSYDSAFNDAANLPPFTPYAIETEKKIWWTS